MEESISATWEKRIAAQPSLFNGTKFRLNGCEVYESAVQGGSVVQGSVCLQLGLTDYRTFVGTNLARNWQDWIDTAAADEVRRFRHFATPLGNGAVVETADNKVLLLRRGTDVGEFPGHPVFPGGHSEPEEVGIKRHNPDLELEEAAALNLRIAEEMFAGITREIVEETGVPEYSLSQPLFIGVSQRKLNARPTAFFYVRCFLVSSEVLLHYASAAHKFESVRLLAVSAEELVPEAAKMPGCHEGGAHLYFSMLARKGLSVPRPLPLSPVRLEEVYARSHSPKHGARFRVDDGFSPRPAPRFQVDDAFSQRPPAPRYPVDGFSPRMSMRQPSSWFRWIRETRSPRTFVPDSRAKSYGRLRPHSASFSEFSFDPLDKIF
eukprot:TRINITY_DN1697_c0_g1_i2.p1 TRINITY_DN1697_c0_g1~~TRINITY_DN1697_c0_g1_i2.p1  ORF type:complete len:431 (+),score=52.39 TRINITY_DN1697_c0_g1_i2:161-1294(+)